MPADEAATGWRLPEQRTSDLGVDHKQITDSWGKSQSVTRLAVIYVTSLLDEDVIRHVAGQ
ncbi:hypothetical protein ATK17_2628 [Branchiibius hedensis]|uniref:Uncharacterized protein n=1 Tax=Branchiibius hedensis TaxID=672460 RepID=A0A2Y8ZZE0_9MICO|nr:hypothetical protein ATK17_2628 [Branchiibius hedensis]SSA35277.1 hypothetical protein SAMN04489750_2628 [Branchiibius hedensis]